MTLTFVLEVIKKNYISETVRASAKMCGRYLYILTFTIEWFIAKFALRDLVPFFEGHECKMLLSLKRESYSVKMHRTTFKDLDIYQMPMNDLMT